MQAVTQAEAEYRHRQACQSVHERYPLLGVARAHHRNKRGEPITFADKPSLIPLYASLLNMREASFCKGVQTGISELLIQLMLYNAGWRDRICAYVLPQYKTSERFVDDRINPLLTTIPAYAARTPGSAFGTDTTNSKGNLKRKRFGRRGSLLFLGAQTGSDFVEFSADMIVVDEYDKCIETKDGLSNVAKIGDRVQESSFPQIFRIANPEYNGQGIHKLWKDGDRSKWFHQCVRCSERQPLVWEEHFVRKTDDGRWIPRDTQRANNPELGDIRPICRRCKKPWDRVATGGLWVPDTAGAPSFHMSRLDILQSKKHPQIMREVYALWIQAQGSAQALQAFHTGQLGWPYEVAGSRVTVEMLQAAMVDAEGQALPPLDYHGGEEYRSKNMIMGVDVGSVLNVTISELIPDDAVPGGYRRRGVLVAAKTRFAELNDLIDTFHVKACVIDAGPETTKAKELRDHYASTGTCDVWLCRFHPTTCVGRDAFGLRMDYGEKVIQVDRTQVFDKTMEDIANRIRTFPGDSATVLGFMDQMKAPIRKFSQEQNRMIWDEGNDPDHFRCADIYERVAQEVADRAGGFWEV